MYFAREGRRLIRLRFFWVQVKMLSSALYREAGLAGLFRAGTLNSSK